MKQGIETGDVHGKVDPVEQDLKAQESAESHKAVFLNSLKDNLLEEGLSVEHLEALVDKAHGTLGVGGEIEEEIAGEIVDWHYFDLMTKATGGSGMVEYFGLRGEGEDGDTNLVALFAQSMDLKKEGERNLNKVRDEKLAKMGVTRQDIYDALVRAKEAAEKLREEKESVYARNVLEGYLKHWDVQSPTSRDLLELVKAAPQLKDLTIGDMAREFRGFESNASVFKLDNLKKYQNVFSFFEKLPAKLGPDVTNLKVDAIVSFLTFTDNLRRVAK